MLNEPPYTASRNSAGQVIPQNCGKTRKAYAEAPA